MVGSVHGLIILYLALSSLLTAVTAFLSSPQAMDRSLKVLDHIPPYDTHKIGVIFVDREQVIGMNN